MIHNTNNNKDQFYITQDVDAYSGNVDNLMDDLFGEVETTLHVDHAKQRSLQQKNGQKNGSLNQAKTSYASVNSSSSDIVAISRINPAERDISTSKDTINITKLNLADISLPPISKQDVLWIQPYIMRSPEPQSDTSPTSPDSAAQKYNLLDRILLITACSVAMIAAVMWTINHGIWLGKQSVQVAKVDSKVPTNKPFAEEISRMLSDITNKNRAIAANANGSMPIGSNIPLMSVPLMSNMPLPSGSNPFGSNMPQQMYIPVYQPPAMNGTNLPSPLALPPVTSNNAIALSAPTPPQNSAFIQAAAPAPSYTLIGVLDLGDRSTAMFDMNGAVQTIRLGKAIGNTGWNVSRVSQQEITIKRGKDSKTVFVGQKF